MKRNPVSQLRRWLRQLNIWCPSVGRWVCIPRTHWWCVFVAWSSCSGTQGRDGSILGSSLVRQPGARNSEGETQPQTRQKVRASSGGCPPTPTRVLTLIHMFMHTYVQAQSRYTGNSQLSYSEDSYVLMPFVYWFFQDRVSHNPGWLWTLNSLASTF